MEPLGYRVHRAAKILAVPDSEHLDILPLCLDKLLSLVPEPYLLQIGANDGRSDDPIHDFVVRHNLRGILLEPQKEAFDALCRTYEGGRLHLENAAIARVCETRTLYRVLEDDDGLAASFSRDRVLAHMRQVKGTGIETETVQCVTFDHLFEKYRAERIDMLFIDAEGFDFEVIKLFDFSQPPQLLYYEHAHLKDRDECAAYVASKGYKLAVSGINTIAWLPLDQ